MNKKPHPTITKLQNYGYVVKEHESSWQITMPQVTGPARSATVFVPEKASLADAIRAIEQKKRQYFL